MPKSPTHHSTATLYRRLGAKARSRLRRRACHGLWAALVRDVDPAVNVAWPLKLEVIDRDKHGGTIRLTGQQAVTLAFNFLGVVPYWNAEPYLIPFISMARQDHYPAVGAALGLDYGADNLWFFELDDRAGGNELLANLQAQIVSSIGPYHLTRNGDCIQVRELGGTFGAGGNITVEYRAQGTEHVTMCGLETYVKERAL